MHKFLYQATSLQLKKSKEPGSWLESNFALKYSIELLFYGLTVVFLAPSGRVILLMTLKTPG